MQLKVNDFYQLLSATYPGVSYENGSNAIVQIVRCPKFYGEVQSPV